jgi:hypothetical protein
VDCKRQFGNWCLKELSHLFYLVTDILHIFLICHKGLEGFWSQEKFSSERLLSFCPSISEADKGRTGEGVLDPIGMATLRFVHFTYWSSALDFTFFVKKIIFY